MSKLFIWILFLSIWHSVLFYGCDYGISVVLFIIPLITFFVYSLKINKRVVNKYGYLFIIPIILLSSTYFIFYNTFFRLFNVIVISILISMMIICLNGSEFKVKVLISNIIKILFKPFGCISNVMHLLQLEISKIFKKKNSDSNIERIIGSIIVTILVLGIIIMLLSSADMIFASIFSLVFDVINGLMIKFNVDHIIGRIIGIIIFFVYISSVMNYLLFHYQNRDIVEEMNKEFWQDRKKKDHYTLKMVMICLNFVYLIFDIIQIKSLFLHSMGNMDIRYAEYARSGFFELMVVSIINFIIILLAKKSEDVKNKCECKFFKVMSMIMVVFTFIILISSFMRMHLYETFYGYTLLRLFVYIILIVEGILFIPTVMYIMGYQFNLFKVYFIIVLSVYVIVNYINIDRVIARENVDRYFRSGKIDMYYLLDLSTDSIYEIDRLYQNTNDEEIKEMISSYYAYSREFTDIKDMDSIFEFNISFYRANRIIDSQ